MLAVLCIDDREEELQALQFQLAEYYRVITCQDASRAAKQVRKDHPSAIVLDIDMPGYDGFRVLSDLRTINDRPPVLMLSAHDQSFFVIRALNEGASDFVAKPYHSRFLKYKLDTMLQYHCTKSPPALDTKIAKNQDQEPRMVGTSAQMCELRDELSVVAQSDRPVLIVGESGTGKELAAQFIHRKSPRAAFPYIVRNLGGYPETLIEGELFGCEEGAFTDARPRKGCFAEANGGTLFLDEIGDASMNAQASLLRIVEDGMLRPLGASHSRHIDCRIISATNRNLPKLIDTRLFREDLMYRLATLSVRVPPLRERRQDIPEMVCYFLSLGSCQARGITEEALDFLCAYDWPGNVRQLKACLDRAALHASTGPIQIQHIGPLQLLNP